MARIEIKVGQGVRLLGHTGTVSRICGSRFRVTWHGPRETGAPRLRLWYPLRDADRFFQGS